MTVWVLEVGLYDPEVAGVYRTLEAAKLAAGDITDWREVNDIWWGGPFGEVNIERHEVQG